MHKKHKNTPGQIITICSKLEIRENLMNTQNKKTNDMLHTEKQR